MDILRKLKDLGIVIPENKEADITSALEGLKDQETINKLIVDAKGKGKNKILKELGFEDIESAKNALKKSLEKETKGNEDGKGAAEKDELASIQKKIEELETKQKQEKEKAEQEKVSSNQINILMKKGFNETAAKRIRNVITQEMGEDDNFEDKLKELSNDEFFKTQFEKASKNLKKGTIEVSSESKTDASDEELAAIASIFGIE